MLSFNCSNVFVSKGYEDRPAVNLIAKEGAEGYSVATFGISASVYDSKAENKKRYVNFPCKAFTDVATRIAKMKLDAGANVNIAGHLDVEEWEDKDTKKKRSRTILVVDDIEYNGRAKKKEDGEASEAPSGTTVSADEDETFDDLPF
ncbi:MAG: single-stranded DNA-binding protein [Acutalibacteraceae bacterium]|nr:single-stranded DNA-binding protein [Acutalibacteraceae bacterium]